MKYLYCSLLLAPLPLMVLSGCTTSPAKATNEISASELSGTPTSETPIVTATPVNAVAQPTAVKFLPPTKVLNAGQAAWTFYSTPTTVMVSRATGGQADLNGTVYEGKFVDRFVPLLAEDGLYCVLESEGEVFLSESEDGKTWKKGLTITNGVKLLDASFSRGEKGGSIYISGEATAAETGINIGDKVEVTAIYNPFSEQWRALTKTKVKVDGN
jgi:hypothetical protein